MGAELQQRMLEMNEQKLARRTGISWAGGLHRRAKVDDLTPKTKLQSYYEHDYEGFLAVLKKNGKKLTIDPARREHWPRAGSGESVGKLGPLQERTDRLIDGCAAVRAHRRGDRDCGGEQRRIAHLLFFIDPIMMT
jgi:hypothetical protein